MNSALVVIDVQESFRQRASWPAVSNPDIVGQVNRLVAATRAAGDLVVWVLHTEPGTGDGLRPGRRPRPAAWTGCVPSRVSRCCTRPRTTRSPPPTCSNCSPNAGIRELVVSGIRTEQCCETTARLAVGPRLRGHVRDRRDGDEPDRAPGRAGRPYPRRDPRRPADAVDRGHRGPDRVRPGRPVRHHPTVDELTGNGDVIRVVFLLIPRLHLLDLAGPAQVFFTAADLGLRVRAAATWPSGRTCRPRRGCRCGPTTRWPELGPDDLVVVPGWRAPRLRGAGPLGPTPLRRLAAHHAAGGTVASVCSGADALGRAGLLDGRRCTTHHELQDELARRYPRSHGGARRAVRRRRPGGHVGRHRQRHRPGAAPDRGPARAWRPGYSGRATRGRRRSTVATRRSQGLMLLHRGGRTDPSVDRFRAHCHASLDRVLDGLRREVVGGLLAGAATGVLLAAGHGPAADLVADLGGAAAGCCCWRPGCRPGSPRRPRSPAGWRPPRVGRGPGATAEPISSAQRN